MKDYTHRFGVAVLLLVLPLRVIASDVQSHGQDPFEPTVTSEENKILTRSIGVAATNLQAAIKILKKEIKDDVSPALDFALGNFYVQQEELEHAAEAYNAALNKMGHFRSAMKNLGRVYLMQNRPDVAIELYQKLVEDGQASADILLLLGHALLLEDAPVGAESAYRQALLLKPRDTEVRMGLAKALLRQERFAEALSLIKEMLDRQPLNQELWSLRVNALLNKGDYEMTIRSIEEARRLNRADSEMLATLGDLWLNRDQPVDALRVYEEAFTGAEPSVDRMFRAIEGFLMIQDEGGAQSMIERAEKALGAEDVLDLRIHLLRLKSELALLKGQTDEAMALSRQVLELDPLDGRALLNLAELQVARGELDAAILTCERAARISGFESDALIRQARIEVMRENYAQAVPLLEAAQAFEPKDHVARYLEQIRRLAE